MQLYDRVLQSRNMNTMAMLSTACAVGLAIYCMLDFLRNAVFVALSDRIGRALGVRVLKAAVHRGMTGDTELAASAIRDLAAMRLFLSSGAIAVPLDALCTPLLLAVMFLLHPAFGWFGVAGISLLTGIGVVADLLVRPRMVAAGEARTAADNQLAAGLRELDLVDGLGMFPALVERWASRHGAALALQRAAAGRSQTVAAVATLGRLVMQAGIVALGAVLVLAHQVSPGALMGANLLLGKLLGPFGTLVSSGRQWIGAGAAWQRISELLRDAESDRAVTTQQAGTHQGPGRQPGLFLNGIHFSDPITGRTILHEINLLLSPGSVTAVVGPNGAGKSTLLRLIVGLLKPSRGEIVLDGDAVATGDRSRIGYLPQSVHLLGGASLKTWPVLWRQG